MQKATPRSVTSLLASTAALGLAFTACTSSDDSSSPTTGSLTGSVLNSPTPVGGVKVTVSGPGGTFGTTTSSNGTYTIEDLPTGEYTIDFCGQGVFDANGDPIADKINLHLPSSNIGSGESAQKPAFLPERALGLTVDTMGTNVGVIPAGTFIENAGVTVFFAEDTTARFVDAADTTISITPVPTEQIPVALPDGIVASALVAIEPAGATFDIRPEISFGNGGTFPGGSTGVEIYSLDYATASWDLSGTASVTASGDAILSDVGEGLASTGWHAVVVDTFCVTDIAGQVVSDTGAAVQGALVTAINGLTTETDSFGEFTIAGVPLPFGSFDVVVTVVPAQGAGFLPSESSAIAGECGSETNMGSIELVSAPVDTVAPTVAGTVPSDQDAGVADNAAISVTFDEPMSPGSLNVNTLTVLAGTEEVAGHVGVSTSGGQTTATFVPSEALPVDTLCSFRISGNVLDAAGNRLGETVEVGFTTAADVAGGATTVAITPQSPANMLPGADVAFTANVTDAAGQAVDGALIEWSADSSFVEVSAAGQIFALSPGTATVRASFGGSFDEVTVTVDTPPIVSVTLAGDESAIAAGSSMPLVASALDTNGLVLAGFQFDWTSSDESVASVNATGLVRAITAGGPVTITATEPNSTLSADFAITVVDPATISEVEVTADAEAIGPDVAVQMSAIARNSNQETIPGIAFSWESSNTSIATVTPTGLVTAVGSGAVQISATANGSTSISGSADLDVYSFEPTVIRFLSGTGDSDDFLFLDVVLHDAATGEALDVELTGPDNSVDFGFIDAERVHDTFGQLQSPPSPSGFSADEMTSVMNVPSGRMTLTHVRHASRAYSVAASFPLGADTLAASVGDPSEGTLQEFDASQSPTSFITSARSRFADSVLVASYDSTGTAEGILAGVFGSENSIDGENISVTLTPEAVSSVPFTATDEVQFVGSRFIYQGLLYRQPSGVTGSAESGTIAFVAPDDATRFAHRFESQSPVTMAVRGRELRSNSAATSLSVGLPSVQLSDLSFDAETMTLSWSMSGSSANSFDMGHARLSVSESFLQGAQPFIWDVYFPASLETLTIPQAKGLPFLTSDQVEYSVELFDQEGVTSYDSFLGHFRNSDGAFNAAALSEGSRLDSIRVEKARYVTVISGSQLGTVTYDTGEGPVELGEGETFDLPLGISVTIVATATATGGAVTELSSPGGAATGVGTGTATLVIDEVTDSSTVFVTFEQS